MSAYANAFPYNTDRCLHHSLFSLLPMVPLLPRDIESYSYEHDIKCFFVFHILVVTWPPIPFSYRTRCYRFSIAVALIRDRIGVTLNGTLYLMFWNIDFEKNRNAPHALYDLYHPLGTISIISPSESQQNFSWRWIK